MLGHPAEVRLTMPEDAVFGYNQNLGIYLPYREYYREEEEPVEELG